MRLICLGLVILAGSILVFTPPAASEPIPEPDAIYYGQVFTNGRPITGTTVSLRSGDDLIDSYTIGNIPAAGTLFVLRARLFHPSTPGESRPSGGVFIGDMLTLSVNAIPPRQIPVAGRGTVTELNISTDGSPIPPTATATATPPVVTPPTGRATATRTAMVTATAGTVTPRTGSPTPTPSPTPSPSPTSPICTGDCDGDMAVTVSELVRAVNIALGITPVTECLAIDQNTDQRVTIAELIAAVSNALSDCS